MISIVDDDESIRGASKMLLRSVGYQVETFASAELFLESDALRETECLILDVRLPGIDGLELQRRLNSIDSRAPIIFVTAHDDKTNRQEAIEAGAVEFFGKPFDGNALVSSIRAALKAREWRNCNSACESIYMEGRISKMPDTLRNKRVAILATDGFEYVELTEPKRALEEAGANAEVVSPKSGQLKGWNHTDWGDSVRVDVNLKSANPNNYDALLLPGGVLNPDHLRQDAGAVQFVKAFFEAHKPVAAICHGPWMLVEANVVRGRKLTSWPSLKTDIKNAGGEWLDQEVVTDQGLVTSRKPADIPAFNKKLIEEVAEGKH